MTLWNKFIIKKKEKKYYKAKSALVAISPSIRDILPCDTRNFFNPLTSNSENVLEMDGQNDIPSHLTLSKEGNEVKLRYIKDYIKDKGI